MNLNIAYSSDDNYAQHLGVSMISLFENNKIFNEINVYIIESKISPQNKERLENIAKEYGRHIHFMNFEKYEEKLKLNMENSISISAYSRLFLSQMLRDINKIIYMDCDSVINHRLYELWNIDLEEYYIAGVLDTVGYDTKLRIGLDKSDNYINSGMLLINLKKWREDNIQQKFIEFINYYSGNVFHHDQGVINGVLRDKILVLHPKYNSMTTFYTMTMENMMKYYKMDKYYSEKEIIEAKNNGVFIHYTPVFVNRPWIKGCKHPLNYVYKQYLDKTPWKDAPMWEDKRSKGEKVVSLLYNNLPFNIANGICNLIF